MDSSFPRHRIAAYRRESYSLLRRKDEVSIKSSHSASAVAPVFCTELLFSATNRSRIDHHGYWGAVEVCQHGSLFPLACVWVPRLSAVAPIREACAII